MKDNVIINSFFFTTCAANLYMNIQMSYKPIYFLLIQDLARVQSPAQAFLSLVYLLLLGGTASTYFEQ